MPNLASAPSAKELIEIYNLLPHPEGGFYCETYRSEGIIPAEVMYDARHAIKGNRNFCTAILFLLLQGDKSSLHRIKQDEIWHYYLGAPIRLVMFLPSGEFREIVIGPDPRNGQHLQYAVPAGTWFGAKPNTQCGDADYSFVGCTVAPGFDFEDFELGKRDRLAQLFPQHKPIIEEFTL
jgi:Uncharacterized conserved protein